MWAAAKPERAQSFFLPLNVRFYGQETAYLSLAFDGPVACVNMEDFLGLSTGKNEHAQVTALVALPLRLPASCCMIWKSFVPRAAAE